MSSVQTVAWTEFEKERHRCAEEMRVRWPAAFSHINIRLHDASIIVHVIAVEAGAMILVFADDPETSHGRFVSFPACRNMGHSNFITAFEQIRFLCALSDDDGGSAFAIRHLRLQFVESLRNKMNLFPIPFAIGHTSS